MSKLPEKQALIARDRILRAIRSYFHQQGFIEVETPVRIAAPANEDYIDPPECVKDGFLRASPELQMKRLLCDGCDKVFQIGPCFRENERGDRHNPEFTMLEWYRANATSGDLLDDMKQFVKLAALAANGTSKFMFKGHEIDSSAQWLEQTVEEAYAANAGWNPLELRDPDKFDDDMAFKIEPSLPKDRICVLRGYPSFAASLARILPEDPRVADRWEAYAGGMELCNAFGELTDPEEQRRRFEASASARIARGAKAMPLDEEFLRALGNMPPSGGAALGIDRLCMALLDLDEIGKARVL